MSEEDIGPTSHDRLPSIEVGTFLVRWRSIYYSTLTLDDRGFGLRTYHLSVYNFIYSFLAYFSLLISFISSIIYLHVYACHSYTTESAPGTSLNTW